MTTTTIKGAEFGTYEEALDYAAKRGGDVLRVPGRRFLAISARDCERIERAGGPATARYTGPGTVAVGR